MLLRLIQNSFKIYESICYILNELELMQFMLL